MRRDVGGFALSASLHLIARCPNCDDDERADEDPGKHVSQRRWTDQQV